PLALLLAFAFPQDGESLDPSKVYEVHDVRGWTVYVEDQLVAQDELASEVLALLSSKLREVVVVLPKDVIERLQQVPIRLHLDRPGCPGGVYHPSSVWLKNHGMDPQWAR
ncbi:MAG: hypothetical protein MK213_06935, partial [Planctomycetes bacterium]|nr:hypothetical protein [Planctomycetota bacterium]